MRPVPAELVETATAVTARYQSAHGAPVHAGDPAELGIADLSRPDFGDQVAFEPGDVPVFWACGVTPQAALTQARLPFAITHSPGHMFITDLPDSALVRPAPSESTGPGPGMIVSPAEGACGEPAREPEQHARGSRSWTSTSATALRSRSG